MIKNIYDKLTCRYYHEYYCDNCLKQIIDRLNIDAVGFGVIKMVFRNDKAIQDNKFDLCEECFEFYKQKNKREK